MTRTTPSIRISQHNGPRNTSESGDHSSHHLSSSFASPMAIPGAREAVPPPLPPPQYLPEISRGRDPGWQWANDPSASDFARPASIKAGSSLLGGFHGPSSQERDTNGRVEDNVRRTSSTSTITPPTRDLEMSNTHNDEDPNTSSLSSSDYRLQSERRMERTAFEGSSQAYDKQLLSRIGGPNTPNKSLSGPAATQDVVMLDRERRNSLLPALGQSHDSTRWLPSMSSSGAISPHVWEASHTRHNSIQSEGLGARSYDHVHEDFPMDDAQQPREDVFGNFKIGAKRRASSPPRDLQNREDRNSLGSASHMSEAQRRANQQMSRDGPPPRFHPSHASVSSVSSYSGGRHGSLGSSLGISSVPSSATSFASGVSPLSASVLIDHESNSAATSHQRSTSDDKRSPTSPGHSRQGSRSQNGVFVCECCPRKFKKFDTEEELRAHESEKQYGCSYCSNRFKNKNEAERHQNSLHLRRHSWSCAALAGFEAAFHSSTSGSDVDICGYCGEEFPNPADWKDRIHHLTNNHKFGQCNQTKKFFRADHFRQHLKHSHDGTSGKWTNMLENACMKDEPPPVKRSDATTSTLLTHTSEHTSQRA